MKAYLILEDGHVFAGEGIGAEKEIISEIVFNTSMTGYLEILTDPSYAGQAVVMTYPLIGNYGVCLADMESEELWTDALIVREISRMASNFRSGVCLDTFLKEKGVPGIAGIDTRALTKILRVSGTMNGMITTKEYGDLSEPIARIKKYRVTGVVARVSCKEKYTMAVKDFVPTDYEEARMTYMADKSLRAAVENAKRAGVCLDEIAMYCMQKTAGIEKLNAVAADPRKARKHYRVAMMDFGTKKNIKHCLLKHGCEVTVYPADTQAEEILAGGYDGIMLSNGPGDPAECVDIIKEVKKLSESGTPIFAICLGHQLMALANGFGTKKMKYGHRGANHPVKDIKTGRVYLSSQNHGYVVMEESVDPAVAELRFINANDKSVEGLSYHGKKIFTVQFHPEACAGPTDTEFLFDEFVRMMEVDA
ncbi:MAG: carbamoyl phosphate synthase small subunit [Lachnospiraceae bacterium]|nr:carbamoyl phosphate synthase small subunit [Lachnospiraceae bacterium]